MDRLEYSEKMKELIKQQIELKQEHMDRMTGIDKAERGAVARAKDAAAMERRRVCQAYREEQYKLECAKQDLRTAFEMGNL